MIKSPIEFVCGIVRQFDVRLSSTLANRYGMLSTLVSQASAMQQNLGDPPSVAGWPAYYQVPQFYELWINSDTLPRRTRFADTMVRSGYSSGGERLRVDLLEFVKTVRDAGDPNVLIDTFTELLYAIPLTANQKAFLKDTLIPGLPDYEWTVEWNAYLADPNNTTNQNAVRGKLQTLVALMTSMPEFHLQ
jgi:hypothetical protein